MRSQVNMKSQENISYGVIETFNLFVTQIINSDEMSAEDLR